MSKYKKGDKVVMEITEKISVMGEPNYILSYATVVNQGYIDEAAEPLSNYTEPLEAKNRRQAAEITRLLAENKELKEDFEKSKIINLNAGRLAGQKEAWELAREILFEEKQGGMEDEKYKAIFGSGNPSAYVIKNHTYSEAAAKVEAWEKAKEEIKVGDVVRLQEGSDNDLCILCKTSDEKYYNAVDKYGALYPLLRKEHFSKTGRHIDIDSFLKQIGEE